MSEAQVRPESQMLTTDGLELTTIQHERSSLVGPTDASELACRYQLEELHMQLHQAVNLT